MSTKKSKSGMMAQQTESTKMLKKEKKVLNADVRKQETNDWSSMKANADTNQRDYVPRRSIKIKSSPENPPNSRSGQTKSSPQKGASAYATKTPSAEVRLPSRSKELANLAVNINSGSIVTPQTTRSDRQIFASIKLEVPCDEDSSLNHSGTTKNCAVKKEECNDNVSMLVHGDTTTKDHHKRRSLIGKNAEEIEIPSARTNRAKSVPRGSLAPSAESEVVSTRNDAMDEAPPVKTPSKDAPNRCKTIESVQKEVGIAEPLKKEQFDCNTSMIANPDTPPRVTPRRSSSVKNREKSVRRSIPSTHSTNAAAVHSSSAVEKSHKDTTKRYRLTESSRKEGVGPSEEQVVPRDTGVSMDLPVSNDISSMPESESSDNDRSSDEDFDPSIKRRKRRSIWDLDSEPDNRNIHRIPCENNNKRKSGTPKGILASSAAITNGSWPADRDIAKINKSTTGHNAIPYEQRRFKCDVCDKRFINSSNLRDHGHIHTGEKKFKCVTCGKRFRAKCNLQTHERIHTADKPFECSFCDKRFSDGSTFIKHKRIHIGEKPYACKFCDKRFIRSDDLQRHMRTHTGEKPFACSICDKQFNDSCNRLVHERIHTGDKPYACTVCDKRFIQSGALQRHNRTHTGEKPYGCTFCDRRFSRSDDLQRHERIHTGEKPFACSICNKRFNISSNRLKHERRHSDNNTEDIPDVRQDCMDQSSSKEASNLLDDNGNQKIRYRSNPIEYIVEKMVNRNPDKVHIVWSKKFSMELASAVSQSGRNCLLMVKKFMPASFPDVLNLSKVLHTCSIEIGPFAKPIRLFSFGGMVVPEKIIHNDGFKSLTKLEWKLSKFARSQGTGIVNIFKHSENNKGWYESLRSNLKEDCIITNKE